MAGTIGDFLLTQNNNAATKTGSVAVNPAEVFAALRRRKWLIVLTTVVVVGAVMAGTLQQDKVYQAKAQVLIEPSLPKVLSDGMAMDNLSEEARQERAFNNTQYKTITNRKVLTDVARRLKLTEDPAYLEATGITTTDPDARLRATVGKLAAAIKVEPEGRSRIVNLYVEDGDPERAARMANALGDAYIDFALESRLENTRRASQWLDRQVAEFAERIENKEAQLNRFQQENQLVSVSLEDRQNMISASLTMLNERLLQNQAEIIEKQAERKVVDALQSSDEPSTDSIPMVQKSLVIQDLKSSLVKLEKDWAELSTRYGEKHPAMVALGKQIVEARNALQQEINNVLRSLDSELQALQTARAGLEGAFNQEKKKALELNSLGLEYNKLTRDLGTTKNVYEALLKRQTEADLSTLLKANFVRWFEQARVPRLPGSAVGAEEYLPIGIVRRAVARGAGDRGGRRAARQHPPPSVGYRRPSCGCRSSACFRGSLTTSHAAARPERRSGCSAGTVTCSCVHNPKSAAAECARSVRTNLHVHVDHPTNLLDRLLLYQRASGVEGKTTTVGRPQRRDGPGRQPGSSARQRPT